MATIRLREYSRKNYHGASLYVGSEKVFNIHFYSPGKSSQMACQHSERLLIEAMESHIHENDTVKVDGLFQRPYLVREWLTNHGYAVG